MKKIMHNISSYLIFLITVSVVVSIGILIYSKVKDFSVLSLSIIVLLYIMFTALIFYVIDYIRRNIIIKKPLNDILDATYLISKGEFDIKLKPSHNKEYYDELDKIMININKMANDLKNEEILKKDFISNFSHEIKTPIAIMSGYIDLLLKKDISKEEKELYINNFSSFLSSCLLCK